MDLPSTLLIGTGEYTTGWTGKGASESDKSAGVVGLVHFDLRERGKIGDRIVMCGTNGDKFPAIRKHLKARIEDFYGLDTNFEQFPQRGRNYEAYKEAIASMSPGDFAVIFTPDDTHFTIAKACLDAGLHVMLTKPVVKTLTEHQELNRIAREKGLLFCIEVHKRYDPIYRDARSRIVNLGQCNYFYSYMSQPTFQLDTFRSWAGKSSDISYYLNSHHIDFHVWTQRRKALPTRVVAHASNGVARKKLGRECEDTITLSTDWTSLEDDSNAVAVYTSSWTAGTADVHSQQRFFYLGSEGEITVDQAHRGYTGCTNTPGQFKSINPLFFRYTPNELGKYAGQQCYGHLSFERFVDAVNAIRSGAATAELFNETMPTGEVTEQMTAILEAGRISLDNDGAPVFLHYDRQNNLTHLQLGGRNRSKL